MVKYFLLAAWRNFSNNKAISAMNVLGLATGICGALVIFLIVHYDFSFDKFEKEGDRVYRVVTHYHFDGNTQTSSGTPPALGDALKKEVTGVEDIVSFHEYNAYPNITVPNSHGRESTIFSRQQGVIFTDKNYFKLVPYDWLAGSPEKALNDPFRAVLTEGAAKAYFPSQPPADLIGKEIFFNDSVKALVAGVVKDIGNNTDLDFRVLISISTIRAGGLKKNYARDRSGFDPSSQLFVRLAAGSSAAAVESQLKTLSEKYNRGDIKAEVYHLQPLGDVHFNSQYAVYGGHIANKSTLYSLLAIAAIILSLGCINFINLTTAQAVRRAREVGIRKTMGSSGKQLMLQFLTETLFITGIATLVSMLAAPFLLKAFSGFIPEDLRFSPLHQPYIILFSAALTILVSVVSGFYPALILCRYNPVTALKDKGYSGMGGPRKTLWRKGLTVFQFFIAQAFIMATIITVKQISYMLNKDLGFKKDAIVLFSVPFKKINLSKPDARRQVLLNELKSIPGIQMLSLGQAPPSSGGSASMIYKDEQKGIETEIQQKSGDTNYLKLYQIKLLAGSNVEQSDTVKEYLINERLMYNLGFQEPRDALNKRINGIPIVGVMADFHEESLQVPIKPLVFSSFNNYAYTFHVLLKPPVAGQSSWKTTLRRMENVFKQVYPEVEFSYQFFDERIAKLYVNEQHFSLLLKWATALAVFISCMGLLGMVMYTTQQRTREIGIRKILGATASHIVSILSKDFIALVLLAFVMAIPLAWLVMQKWLENFAYRTTINGWVFLLSGSVMLLMAFITLSIRTMKAAMANPIVSLRNE